MLDSINCW